MKEPFTKLEFENQNDDICNAFNFVLDQIKQIWGENMINIGGKKERALNSEVNLSGSLARMFKLVNINTINEDLSTYPKYRNIVVSDAVPLEDNTSEVSENEND
jgi:hypothetical protein